jgi:hypothetical protein
MAKRLISKKEFGEIDGLYFLAGKAFKEANETQPEMIRGRLDGDDDMEMAIRQGIQDGQPLDDLLEKLNVKVEEDNNR